MFRSSRLTDRLTSQCLSVIKRVAYTLSDDIERGKNGEIKSRGLDMYCSILNSISILTQKSLCQQLIFYSTKSATTSTITESLIL
ncbi:CLUMA_CG018582, isoform A [Clunio marinus]|uniref:CLUMA_CG018582, isoform A n=1 Tax=Clunio marinus TaxID=568069 RepID=A0A1J1IYJ5_9DIPT|nr:CLUMA_CG018582, isoform A [Clunio marinus]